MDDFKIAKIQKFINDKALSEAVFSVLLDSFLKERANQDVYILAASRLSVDYLKQGWKELERYKETKEEVNEKVIPNIGL